jgi:hypothetical protein
LLQNYFCDFESEVSAADRDAIDKALEEFLDKKSLYYGYNHSNPSVNCLRKATKNVHEKVNLIYTASKEDAVNHINALATVQSVGFKNYFYKPDDKDGDPDVLKWDFQLGAKHRPLEKRDIGASTPGIKIANNLLGSVASNGQKRSSRVLIQKQLLEEQAAQRLAEEAEAERSAEEEAEKKRLAAQKLNEQKSAGERAVLIAKNSSKCGMASTQRKNLKSLASTPKVSAQRSARKPLKFTESADTSDDDDDTSPTPQSSSSKQDCNEIIDKEILIDFIEQQINDNT